MRFVFLLLALVLLKDILIYKVCHALPLAELKRRARAHEPGAVAINKLAAYGEELDLLLWLIGLAAGIALILWSAATNQNLAILVIFIVVWLVVWSPNPRPGGWLWRFTAWSSRYVAAGLSRLRPVFRLVAGRAPDRIKKWPHSGLYEKEDLLQFINAQNHQIDNRISQADLKAAFNALSFADQKVSGVMTSRRKARFVAASEPIGPLLMDELHATGQTRFALTKEPVKKSAPQIIGSLYLGDLLKNLDKPGNVKDISTLGIYFINQDCPLRMSLDAFLKTGSQLLVAVDKFQEVTGVLTLDEVLKQLIGTPTTEDFNDYANLPAVAGMQSAPEKLLPDDHQELSPK